MLRYEIALEIETGCIVWAYRGFPPGEYPDLKIARKKFIKMLYPGERVVGDKGCKDSKYFIFPEKGQKYNNVALKRIMARHENVNRRIKTFSCLSDTFRHDLSLHHIFFQAVINVIQIAMKNGNKLPSIKK